MAPVRILQIVHNYPPEFAGGTERYVAHLAAAMQAAGHEVLVACGSEETRPGGAAQPFLHDSIPGVRFHRAPEEAYGLVPFHPRLGAALLDLARKEGIQAVHLHHWFHLDLGLALKFRAAGVPVLLTLHDLFALCPRFFRVRPGGGPPCDSAQDPAACAECVAAEAGGDEAGRLALLEQRASVFAAELAAAREVVVFSRALAGFVQAWPYFPAREIRVAPPGIPAAERFRAAALPAPEGPPWRVGYWGGLCRAKGVDLLARALARPDLAGRAELHLWGPLLEPELAGELETIARSAGYPLRLHGVCPWEELPERLAGLALAAFPSRCFETYGLAVDEALLLGLPVIVPRLGALPERLGQGGLCFAPGDAEDLGAALARILLDPTAWRGRPHAVPSFDAHVQAMLSELEK